MRRNGGDGYPSPGIIRVWRQSKAIALCMASGTEKIRGAGAQTEVEQMTETHEAQIERLARFILEEVDGEPRKSEGAVDTAIRIIRVQGEHRDRVCPECGHCPAGKKFCVFVVTPTREVSIRCPRCNGSVAYIWRYCENCGKKVKP